MRYSILFCFCISLLFACSNADKNTKSISTKKTTNSIMSTLENDIPDIQIPSSGMETKDLSHIKTIPQEELMPFLENYAQSNPETKIQIETKQGTIIVQLFDEPVWHRANFIRLAKLEYFDTCLFHRVDPNFVIQAGNSDRRLTSDYRSALGRYLIPSEYTDKYPHNYGAFAAAKYKKQNVSNASSPFEFYIVTKKDGAHHLDGEHTVFGQVIKGMDVAEKISMMETDKSEWPISNIDIKVQVIQ
jgi:cyclophilin family peptidyl-prolyl cis-trans isomerase